ncbi:HAD family hydrolase [Chloroflexota bacterium]
MKYEAVIFDLFGTLVNNIPYSEQRKLFVEVGTILKAPGEEVFRLWSDIWELRGNGFFQSTRETLDYICNKLEISAPDTKLEYAVQMHCDYIERQVIPYANALGVLTRLKSEGYKTGLITDCSAGTVNHWEKIPLSHLIDAPVFSCSERVMKPNARIYLLVSERLGVEPQNCLYIGDGGSQELTGAAEVGMHPVLIRHPDEVSSEIYYEREEWNGPVISSLKEVIDLVNKV